MPEKLLYDVFLSYCSRDKSVVRELAQRLKSDGLAVWFDEWAIRPGDSIPLAIQHGLSFSRVLVLVMSRQAAESDWIAMESGTFLFRDPANRERRFVPLRLDDGEIRETLKQYAYVDWRQQSAEQYARLITACRSQKPSQTAEAVTHSLSVIDDGPSSTFAWGIAVTPNGRLAVSGSVDNAVQVWDLVAGTHTATLRGHRAGVHCVAITPDGRRAASGSIDKTMRIWDLEAGTCVWVLGGHAGSVLSVAIADDGLRAISASQDSRLCVWDLGSGSLSGTLEGHAEGVLGVAMTPDGRIAVSGSIDRTVRIWDVEERKVRSVLDGHQAAVVSVAISADGRRVVSGSLDKTLRVWDVDSARLIATLEGHTSDLFSIAMTPDGKRAVSASGDGYDVWDIERGQRVDTLYSHSEYGSGIGITADGAMVVATTDLLPVCIWALPPIGTAQSSATSVRYSNAKVLLVGDSGVGKTGLAYRLTENEFRPSYSTDAAWATQLKLPQVTGRLDMEREIWLWDFAGQADYRLVHQLYMDETALAVLVFNPQSDNPFEGLGQWDRDLLRAARRPFRKLLVAGRIDRGGLMISRESIERFRVERGFEEYVETSALEGTGCDGLRDAIINHIPWDEIPWIASPRIFKLLKDEVIKLKDEGIVLLRMSELKQQLAMRLIGEYFSIEELRAVVGLLVGPGVVWQLEFGDFVLLQPERINSYAAAVVRSVRSNTEEIGCIAEEQVLKGSLEYADMKRLPHVEEEIVLRAMHQTLVDHNLCLREHTDAGTMLIFPSYFKRERPELEGHPLVFVSYLFSGAVEDIYATLVVRLHHTAAFERDQLWKFAAEFRTPSGKRLGLKMLRKAEGAAELQVYFEKGIALDTEATFIRYVHEHLVGKAQGIERVRHYVCPSCGYAVKDTALTQQVLKELGKRAVLRCQQPRCETRFSLWDVIEEKFASQSLINAVRELEQHTKMAIHAENRELIAEAHIIYTVAESGYLWRRIDDSEMGYDGEVELRDSLGNPTDKRLCLLYISGETFTRESKDDISEIISFSESSPASWQDQPYPVLLVIRTSDGIVRWADIREVWKMDGRVSKRFRQFEFRGEPLTALALRNAAERLMYGER